MYSYLCSSRGHFGRCRLLTARQRPRRLLGMTALGRAGNFLLRFGAQVSPKAHILKAWSLAWCCWKVMEALEGGAMWGLWVPGAWLLRTLWCPGLFLGFSFHFLAVRWVVLLCLLFLPWHVSTAQSSGAHQSWTKTSKTSVKINPFSLSVNCFTHFFFVVTKS